MTNETLPAMVDTVIEQPMDFTVMATSPAEMEGAQRSLILWCARKIQATKEELAEAKEQLEIARQNKWNTSAWSRQALKHERRGEFYRKIKSALEAGYYIVPPFPLDIFAIRTDRVNPERKDSEYRDNHNQKALSLPEGQGRYVDPKPIRQGYIDKRKKADGTIRDVTMYYAREFASVDFPFKLAKPEVLGATAKAMALKIFDRLGVLPAFRAADPIVCGQILYPDQPRYGEPKTVTFFVAWWLDTKTL